MCAQFGVPRRGGPSTLRTFRKDLCHFPENGFTRCGFLATLNSHSNCLFVFLSERCCFQRYLLIGKSYNSYIEISISSCQLVSLFIPLYSCTALNTRHSTQCNYAPTQRGCKDGLTNVAYKLIFEDVRSGKRYLHTLQYSNVV